MPKKQIRGNTYYEEQLRNQHPAVHADYLKGKYGSLGEALVIAGIKKRRTRLQELKNAWTKASPVEQQQFERWLAARASGQPAGAGTKPIAVNRHLEQWAKHRIKIIMQRRYLSMGDVMQELGSKRLDASLGSALSNNTQLRPAILVALEKWFQANSGV